MAQYVSENSCSAVIDNGYEGLFQHDRGTSQIVVKDPLLTSEAVATERAKAELLKGGYVERWIRITSVHTAGLKQNDIISFNGVYWLVKEITLSFQAPKLVQTIKGLRYE